MPVRLIEVAPGKWRVERPPLAPARSDLPLPFIISDQMPPTEQVDGRFYTSKRAFRSAGRALGLTEIGTEKYKPKPRVADRRAASEGRRRAIRTALAKFRAGHRP
jgi:hypothetical protein